VETQRAPGAIAQRVSQLWRRSSNGRSPRPPSADAEWRGHLERRLETLDARLQHLETAHEGLQDAVYRQAILEDEQIADLRRRTEPEHLARELSDDARRRGL
jgi:hypothetical protein